MSQSDWPNWPYSTKVDIASEAKPKRYCGIHHNGFYGDCEACLQRMIFNQLKDLASKWARVAHLLQFLNQAPTPTDPIPINPDLLPE